MKEMKFKTTIKCSGCVAAVTPVLDEKVGKGNWNVDLADPEKILTVKAGEEFSALEVIEQVKKAGYIAESK